MDDPPQNHIHLLQTKIAPPEKCLYEQCNTLSVYCDDEHCAWAVVISDTIVVVPEHALSIDTIKKRQKEKEKEKENGENVQFRMDNKAAPEVDLWPYINTAVEVKFGAGDFVMLVLTSNVLAPPDFYPTRESSIRKWDKLENCAIQKYECQPGDSGRTLDEWYMLLGGEPESISNETGFFNSAVLVSLKSILNFCRQHLERSKKIEQCPATFPFKLPAYVPLSFKSAWKETWEVCSNPKDGECHTLNWKGMKVSYNSYDREIMKMMLGDNETRKSKLKLVIGGNDSSQCWVGPSGAYQDIGQFAATRGFPNYDDKSQYPHAKPLTLISKKITEEAAGKCEAVCHHPLICELKAHTERDLGNDGRHTCMRPSHLMLSSNNMNTLHQAINQLMYEHKVEDHTKLFV